MLAASRSDDGEASVDSWRKAAPGEQGDVIIRRPYPYMALTVWKSEGFGTAAWRGDLERWAGYFAPGVGYVQGDSAIKYADGAFTVNPARSWPTSYLGEVG